MYVVVRVRSPCSVGFVVLQTFESDRLFAVEAASSVRGDATLQTKDLPVSASGLMTSLMCYAAVIGQVWSWTCTHLGRSKGPVWAANNIRMTCRVYA